MSEFTENYKERVNTLVNYMLGLIDGGKRSDLLSVHKIRETKFMPHDILYLFDEIYSRDIEVDKIKIASNRLFNILYEDLSAYEKYNYPDDSIIAYLIKDNSGVKKHLADAREYIKKINKEQSEDLIQALIRVFEKLQDFSVHYTIKENIVFPEIEKKWDHYQCLKLMWTFHDDIRQNIKKTLEILKSTDFDLKLFNQFCGKVYFNINTIVFREENVLYPVMYETMEVEVFDRMVSQLVDFNFVFAELGTRSEQIEEEIKMDKDNVVKFSTGELNLEQLELIFSHLPVDITFVDQNDKVRYFSSPKERIFPRTTGIIGRTVMDCHPHESAEIVGRIIATFKSGEKDDASFWLRMGPKYVLIRYFAVRDKGNTYKGVLEVSQEISEIKAIEGEHRLLDW
ncbi:MAG: DUF438 domain-containing protein [Spirochaetales bacterium]|nr:DUF438 domain-containing protein [Spirochaetales bacterium]